MAMAHEKQVPYRGPKGDLEALGTYAQHYGRSLNNEMQLAVRSWKLAHALRLLQDPVEQAALEAQGIDPAAEQRRVKAALGELMRNAYTPSKRTTRVPPEPPLYVPEEWTATA